MIISNLELIDAVNEKVYTLLTQEPLLERRLLTEVWKNVPYDVISQEICSFRSKEEEAVSLTSREYHALVNKFAESFLLNLKTRKI